MKRSSDHRHSGAPVLAIWSLAALALVLIPAAAAWADGDDDAAAGRGTSASLFLAQSVAQTGSAAGDLEGGDDSLAIADPLEPINRGIFAFNQALDTAVIAPAARLYRELPDPARKGVSNFLAHLRSPVILINDLLQGEFERAGVTLSRFAINTVAFLGLFDAASDIGLEAHDEDFGQTLAVWGVGDGLYLVLPVFGPSTPRDAVGLAVDGLWLDSLNLYLRNTDQSEWVYARGGAVAIDSRSQVLDDVDELKRASTDFYATIRSLYVQRRMAQINNGFLPNSLPAPSLSLDVLDEPSTETAARSGAAN
ncbi:MAG: VacJ family lipoprotein [Alphaproteobacteria bacterium]